MEVKISVKKNPEISFTFDNQKKEQTVRENSKLQAKATVKCSPADKLGRVSFGPAPGQPDRFLLEIIGKMPIFSKQMRSNTSVKKPKWTAVNNAEGSTAHNPVVECNLIIPTLEPTVIRAYVLRENLIADNVPTELYKKTYETLRKLENAVRVLDLKDFNQTVELKPYEELKGISNPPVKTEPSYEVAPNQRMDKAMSSMVSRNHAPVMGDKYGQKRAGHIHMPPGAQFPIYNGQSPSMHQGGVPRYPEAGTVEVQPPAEAVNFSRSAPYHSLVSFQQRVAEQLGGLRSALRAGVPKVGGAVQVPVLGENAGAGGGRAGGGGAQPHLALQEGAGAQVLSLSAQGRRSSGVRIPSAGKASPRSKNSKRTSLKLTIGCGQRDSSCLRTGASRCRSTCSERCLNMRESMCSMWRISLWKQRKNCRLRRSNMR
eukprot:TRINITY_DN1412_c0_g1_i6.p1 TRINITY_DN1412_c0_g1~~TRINITY_DN1412_c0_g1_i6.p1  ORF type:complete len:429 (+),score=32.19 TRINITY_DN1412_c0_g1_i6:341-1627(+)